MSSADFSSSGTFDISGTNVIGAIHRITPKMEFSFELKIENMDSCEDGSSKSILWIHGESAWWFGFNIHKSSEESKYYIFHLQNNGLGPHYNIRKLNPIRYSNTWQKEILKIVRVSYFNLFFVMKNRLTLNSVPHKERLWRYQKVLIKNTPNESGQCQTIIEIDGDIIFTSRAYTWEHPESACKEFEIETGDDDDRVKGAIRNIEITTFE